MVKVCQRCGKVDKCRVEGYMDCGILRVYGQCQHEEKRVNAPTKDDIGCFARKKKVSKGDNRNICQCWKQRLFTMDK
jgi:hypothetical protein